MSQRIFDRNYYVTGGAFSRDCACLVSTGPCELFGGLDAPELVPAGATEQWFTGSGDPIECEMLARR